MQVVVRGVESAQLLQALSQTFPVMSCSYSMWSKQKYEEFEAVVVLSLQAFLPLCRALAESNVQIQQL